MIDPALVREILVLAAAETARMGKRVQIAGIVERFIKEGLRRRSRR